MDGCISSWNLLSRSDWLDGRLVYINIIFHSLVYRTNESQGMGCIDCLI